MQPAPITVGGSVLTRCTPDSVWSGFGRWHPNELAAVVGVLVLVGSDAVALVVAWVSAYAILAPAYSLHDWTQPSMVLLVVCLCVWLAAQGDYTDRKSLDKEFPQTSLVIWLAALLAYRQVGPSIILSLIAIVSLTTARVISRWVLYKGGLTRLPAVVVGSSKACQSLCRVMANDWYRGFSIVDEIICTGAHVDDITTPLAELMKCRRIAHVIVVDGICPSEMRKLEELVDQLRLTLSVGYLLEGSEQRVVADRFFGSGYVSLRRVRSIYALPYPAIKRRSTC